MKENYFKQLGEKIKWLRKAKKLTLKGELMNEIELNDFIAGILRDLIELESMLQVLKDASFSKGQEITMDDVGNTLEVMVDKAYNTKISLNKYIDTAFCKE